MGKAAGTRRQNVTGTQRKKSNCSANGSKNLAANRNMFFSAKEQTAIAAAETKWRSGTAVNDLAMELQWLSGKTLRMFAQEFNVARLVLNKRIENAKIIAGATEALTNLKL